jgi:hypothetical protein
MVVNIGKERDAITCRKSRRTSSRMVFCTSSLLPPACPSHILASEAVRERLTHRAVAGFLKTVTATILQV